MLRGFGPFGFQQSARIITSVSAARRLERFDGDSYEEISGAKRGVCGGTRRDAAEDGREPLGGHRGDGDDGARFVPEARREYIRSVAGTSHSESLNRLNHFEGSYPEEEETPFTMKLSIVVLAALIAVVASRPQNPKDVTITSYSSDNIGLDGYNFQYALSDGTSRQETGELKNAGTENEALVVRGSFTYRGEDGKEYTINFVADENGYQPQGEHLPK
ncbi:hypothetical protein J437_LFUL001858 [Ladona fulva]|uniref:Uncharacterized protein n=1 Tax=Ladona fulva TaxID=123851 RepID=A0A8K0JTC4_LADFU|nr:hypothetical protein J437_LFUL001858 [Ladona fulva]